MTERETKLNYYFRDHGLQRLFLPDGQAEAMENIIFNSLARKFPNEVCYLRDNYEVDFYVPGKQL